MTYSPELNAKRARRARQIRHLRAAGLWSPKADVTEARDHIERLQSTGVTRQEIADAALTSHSTIYRIKHGIVTTLDRGIVARILAADPIPNPALVDATGCRRRLQAFVADGFTQSYFAPRIGWKVGALSPIVTGLRTRITRRTRELICDLYERMADEVPPAGRERTYAVNIAARNGWVGRDHWPSGTIDHPDATPSLEPVEPDRVVVERLTTGKIPLAAVSARADRIAAVRKLARAGLGDATIATRMRSSKVVVTKLLAEVAA